LRLRVGTIAGFFCFLPLGLAIIGGFASSY
jgi:hypothetical protein